LAQFFFDVIPGFTTDIFYAIKAKYEMWNFWVIFTAGFTPIPFKVFTVSAGAFDINFILFLIASTLSRSARFLLISGLIWKYGEPIREFIDNYFNKLAILFTVLLIGSFVLIKYLI
jgi:membrane protein YqaA with SNARE-associated domain